MMRVRVGEVGWLRTICAVHTAMGVPYTNRITCDSTHEVMQFAMKQVRLCNSFKCKSRQIIDDHPGVRTFAYTGARQRRCEPFVGL